MWSFLTGLACATVLAGGTYWAMQAGTITMIDRFDDPSTVLGGIWEGGSSAAMSAPLVTQGNVEQE